MRRAIPNTNTLHKQNNSLRYVFHDMSFTVAPPKKSGNNEEAVKLNIHCTKKCILVNNRGHGNAPRSLPNIIYLV